MVSSSELVFDRHEFTSWKPREDVECTGCAWNRNLRVNELKRAKFQRFT